MKKMKISCLVMFLLGTFVIFYEALMPGNVSLSHSNKFKIFIEEIIERKETRKEKKAKEKKYYVDETYYIDLKDGYYITLESGNAIINNNSFTPKKAGNIVINIYNQQGTLIEQKTFLAEHKTINILGSTKNLEIFVRKYIGHFGAFFLLGVLGFLCAKLFITKFYLGFSLNLVVGFIIAGISELLQLIPSGRCAQFKDVIIDFSGYLLANLFMLLFYAVYKIFKKDKVNLKK